MRVLVVTAVPVERDAVTRAFGDGSAAPVREAGGAEIHRAGPFDVLAGGAGPAAAAAAAAFALATAPEPYGLVISAGIGGGFAPAAPLGSLVVASAIVAADLGADTPDGFLPVTALGFGRDRFTPPPALVREVAAATGGTTGEILTVCTVTGTAERTAALLTAHPAATAEAMEGFGVAEAAGRAGAAVLEIRAVSNAVGPRDRAAWRIGDALTALTGAFGKLIPVLEGWTPHDRNHA
ncbi:MULTISPECIES: futalosine hydrolase [unclassified Streptomyces]|uniref:futalosine hydrolase n=1 Tax=unclassified Streptomyces TaxID=2593676 RepID=UPI00225A989C|nr:MULTISPECIES: futalosine hydrolase [unclassified Streptomyces]WSP56661.1 futalosine hydrolase [Streptomyces sp. NBC_01241]WSU22621.1 futalosine hydrolase [Streptomyces sp. NBC_01108]MCX4788408.1 futalosine hydrolase [Streptomyces sp. NBC_01221]MCX4795831.1 futalosine hydrolase [Streptomyces sp. NBC_01242]WSJ37113.1 futalosine hydrolase [Streptomyces sp. NBC_01321]